MYTTRFHKEFQKDSYLIPKLNTFSFMFMASIPRSGFWQKVVAGNFCIKKQSIRILSRLHSEKNIPDKGCICNLNCYHFENFMHILNNFLGGNTPQFTTFYESVNSITYIQDT